MEVHLEIPDSVCQALQVPHEQIGAELHKELALSLYARGTLSAGRAAELAGVTRIDFEKLLSKRKIVRNYSMEDLEHDLRWADEQQ